jgi:hypothetical protein
MPRSRQQRRARARSPLKKRRRGAIWFTAFLVALLAAGTFGIVFSRANPPPVTRGASVGEHWHAAYRIYVCGNRVANYPSVEGEIHSHGDGFMHIHPATPAFSGDNANLGQFLRLYETGLGQLPDGKKTLVFPDGTVFKDGGRCPNDKKRYNVELLNKGKKVEGDPGRFLPHEGDAIVIRFGPQGEKVIANPYSRAKGITEPPAPPRSEPAPD